MTLRFYELPPDDEEEPLDPDPTLDEVLEGADVEEDRYIRWLFGERNTP